jgi:pimeloyl-ACP methyl ester carboxylesterase
MISPKEQAAAHGALDSSWTHAFFIAGIFLLSVLNVGRAQETADSFSSINLSEMANTSGVLALNSTNILALKAWTDDQLSVLAEALGEVPTIPVSSLPRAGLVGTYWSLQQPDLPPLPGDTIGVNAWPMADGSFLLDDLNFDYNAPLSGSMMMGAMGSPLFPGGGDDGDTNDYKPCSPMTVIDYGTNLWIAQAAVVSGYLNGIATNTSADITYDIFSSTNLSQTDWQYENSILGSEVTNWTPLSVFQGGRSNLFVRLRSDADDGSGLPIWWQLQYFGTNGVDPNGDPSGDGWSNLQKYQNDWNPSHFYTPPPPPAFSVFYNSRSGTVTMTWQPSQGNVNEYSISRFDPNTGWTTVFPVLPASATSFVDNSPITAFPPENGEPAYTIYAVYSGGNSACKTLTMFNSGTTVPAQILPRSQDQNQLLVPGPIPSGTTALLLTRSDFDWDTEEYTEATFNLPLSSLNNNTAVLPITWFDGASLTGAYEDWYVQTVNGNGSVSDMTQADSLWWFQGVQQNPPPFFDGRQQMAQNAIFLLRAANAVMAFNYNYYPNYGYAGLYDVNYIASPYCNPAANGNIGAPLDAFRPFVENYFYHNFVLSMGDLDPTTGYLTTGLGISMTLVPTGVLGPSEPASEVTMSSTPTYQFQLTDTNLMTIQAILDPIQTPWMSCYPQSETNVSWPYFDAPFCDGVNDANGNYSMSIISSNFYGLQFLSTCFTYNTNGSLETPILNAGGTISQVPTGGMFSQTAIPQLETVDYYFAQPQSYLLPGEYYFSPDVPNNTNNLVAGFGQTNLFAGYAKQVLLNGYPGVYSYLGQYFQAAYQIDTNGDVTTNSAGVISPYGVFVPTVAGPAALVTMTNWGENVQGTGIVQVVKLVLDVNHDGVMDLTLNGPDNTSAANPYVFWRNNNFDRSLYDADDDTNYDDDAMRNSYAAYTDNPKTPTPDYDYSSYQYNPNGGRAISTQRDLEDFARLWVCGFTTNLLNNLPYGSVVTLSWGDMAHPNTNNPTIDLFTSIEADGGIGYLTNSDLASIQVQQSQGQVNGTYVGRIGPGQGIALSSFDNDGNPTWLGNYFIWCGVSNGTGGLTLTIWDPSSNILAQTTEYVQIKDIKQMYERWTVGDTPGEVPSLVAVNAMNDLTVNSMTLPFNYEAPQDTNTPYILFVHGWNMTAEDKDRFAEAAFKRLFWQGYHGRFGVFRWPTDYDFNASLIDAILQPHNYDSSENQAWNSAAGLLNKLTDLNTKYPGHVYVLAHSMGNVVTGEALRLAAQQGLGEVVNTYVASQAAIPAHVYDATVISPYLINYAYVSHGYPAPGHPLTPNIYSNRLTNNAAAVGRKISLYNVNDYALNRDAWCFDQEHKPDTFLLSGQYRYSGSTNDPSPWNHFEYDYFAGGVQYFDIVNSLSDRYNVLAYAANPYSMALGAIPEIITFDQNFSLQTLWPADTERPNNPYSEHFYHSAQFRGDCWQEWAYWHSLLFSSQNGFNISNP